jgi:hypothetical protein
MVPKTKAKTQSTMMGGTFKGIQQPTERAPNDQRWEDLSNTDKVIFNYKPTISMNPNDVNK